MTLETVYFRNLLLSTRQSLTKIITKKELRLLDLQYLAQ